MNKIIVNSAVLLTALQTVGKAFGKCAVPIIESYLFHVSNGMLTISATDLRTTLKLCFSIESMKGVTFSAVVPPTILKYLAKIDEQALTLTYDHPTYSIEITGIDERAKYSGEDFEGFPVTPQTNIELFENNSDLFKEFKDLLNYTTGDQTRPAMTGIGFLSYCGEFTMCATDGHRLKTVNIPALNTNAEFESEQHFILPAKAAKLLSDFKFDVKKTRASKSVDIQPISRELVKVKTDNTQKEHISFSFNLSVFEVELITRNIDERFPQYWNVIPQPEAIKTKFTVDKKTFLKVLNKAELFANSRTHQIKLSLNGVNKISAEDLDFSQEYSGQIGGSYTGEPIQIGFNAEFLRETVNSFGETFTLEMIAENKCAIIREGNSLSLVMPVMLNQYV